MLVKKNRQWRQREKGMLHVAALYLVAAACNPNRELGLCRTELEDVADRIELTLMEHPDWKALFTINDELVSTTLQRLAEAMTSRFDECPCIGQCSLCSTETESRRFWRKSLGVRDG